MLTSGGWSCLATRTASTHRLRSNCITGWSRPFSRYGDELQFRVLMNEEVQDATDDGREHCWMDVAAEYCPQRLAEWIAAEFRAKRLLSRQVL